MTDDTITSKEYQEYAKSGKLPNRIANPDAKLEPTSGHESLAEKEDARFNSPVRLVVHHVRRRLLDPDNLSIKAALDGLVQAGILTDDTAKQIKSITHTQEKGKEEKTIITIYRA